MSASREGSQGAPGEASRADGDAPASSPLDLLALAGVDHDLRTLVGGVMRLAERLLTTRLDGEQQELAKRIRANGAAISELLGDLRAMGELAPGAAAAVRVDFDLRRTVEEVGEALAADAEQRGAELVVIIPPEVPGGVRGDAARLRQVLGRLGAFALASASAGEALGGEVVLRAELVGESAGGVVARFEVSYAPGREDHNEEGDRRSGLRFDPFSPALGGAGLGLALAKRLVEALGGQLQSATDEGGGGLLWFELAFERRGRSTTRGLVPRIDLGGMRALVVDDSPAAQAAARGMVELLSMECDVAGAEADAAGAMRASVRIGRPYNLLLLDAALPGGAAARLRAEATTAGTKVVLMAYPGQASLIGDAHAIPKPVRAVQLHTTLRSLLQPPTEDVAGPSRAAFARKEAPASPEKPPRRSGAYQAVRIEVERPPPSRPGGSSPTPYPGAPPERPAPPEKPATHAGEQRPRTEPSGAPGEPDVVALVIDLLVTRAPALAARMREAAAQGRMDELGALGRELRDEASRLSLVRLADLCARAERQARAGTPEGAAAAVQAIEDEVARGRASLSAEQGRRGR